MARAPVASAPFGLRAGTVGRGGGILFHRRRLGRARLPRLGARGRARRRGRPRGALARQARPCRVRASGRCAGACLRGFRGRVAACRDGAGGRGRVGALALRGAGRRHGGRVRPAVLRSGHGGRRALCSGARRPARRCRSPPLRRRLRGARAAGEAFRVHGVALLAARRLGDRARGRRGAAGARRPGGAASGVALARPGGALRGRRRCGRPPAGARVRGSRLPWRHGPVRGLQGHGACVRPRWWWKGRFGWPIWCSPARRCRPRVRRPWQWRASRRSSPAAAPRR